MRVQDIFIISLITFYSTNYHISSDYLILFFK